MRRFNLEVGSLLPGLRPPVTRLSPGLVLDASVGVQSLEESRGPFGPGLSSTPSAGDNPATPPENSLAEVRV
jgi:hypothetical protein